MIRPCLNGVREFDVGLHDSPFEKRWEARGVSQYYWYLAWSTDYRMLELRTRCVRILGGVLGGRCGCGDLMGRLVVGEETFSSSRYLAICEVPSFGAMGGEAECWA